MTGGAILALAAMLAAVPAARGPLPHGGAATARKVKPTGAHPPHLPSKGAARARVVEGSDPRRARLAAAAARRIGEPFPGDCSDFVLRALRDAGVPLPPLGRAASRSEALWRAAEEVAAPRPGDLAFFHDTYDRDRDGKPGDRFTHVAIVEAVEGSAVVLVHRGGKGVERLRMHLDRPRDGSANDPLRVKRASDVPGTRYLAGELFAAFGGLLGVTATQMLQAGHGAVEPVAHPSTR